MSEWQEGTLSDIAEFVMGQSPEGETCNEAGAGVPLLNGPTEFGIRNPKAVQFTTDPKRFSKSGDILFCVRGSTTGKMNWSNQEYAIGRGLAALRHKNGAEYKYFLKAVIDFNLELLLASATGSTFPNVSKDQIANLEVSIPTLEEQKAIASVLSSLDDKIDLLQRQNTTLERMAETLFRQWFVEEAQDSNIGQFIDLQNGYAFKSQDFKDIGEQRVLKIKNISGGIIDVNNTDFIDAAVASKTDAKFKVVTGDILFAMTGAEIGKLGIVPKTNTALWLNQRVGLLKEKFKGARFLAYLQLNSEIGQDYIENSATGSAQPNISGSLIEQCPFPKVEVNKIKECSEILDVYYQKLISNLGQIQTLEKLRDNLLPKLMSGEVHVN